MKTWFNLLLKSDHSEGLKHQNGQGSAGEAVVNKAALSDSLKVDTVAGATYSSKVLLKAMENALRKGLAP